jgi:Cft2 family RNA processing exonuclease
MEEEKERREQDLFNVMSLIRTAPYNKVMRIVPRIASATFYNA